MYVEIDFPITSAFACISYVVLLKVLINMLPEMKFISSIWIFFLGGGGKMCSIKFDSEVNIY